MNKVLGKPKQWNNLGRKTGETWQDRYRRIADATPTYKATRTVNGRRQ